MFNMIKYCILFLFVNAIAASPQARTSEAKEIENVIEELLGLKTRHQHVRNEHSGSDDTDSTNVETINLLLKHNTKEPPGPLFKPIGRTGNEMGSQDRNKLDSDSQFQSDLLYKLGVRCGCGDQAGRCGGSGNSERCGCKSGGCGNKSVRCGCNDKDLRCGCNDKDLRCGCNDKDLRCGCNDKDLRCSTGHCDVEHDHTFDNAIILETDNTNKINKNRYNHQNDKKNRVDPTIVNLLDDFEKSLTQSNNDVNELANIKLLCVGEKCESTDHLEFGNHKDDDDENKDRNRNDNEEKSNNFMSLFVENLQKALNDPDKNDNKNTEHIQCCKNCERQSHGDDKVYLSCCKKCGKNKYSTNRNRVAEKDRRDEADRERREKSAYQYERPRSDNKDKHDKSLDRARIFQLNDDLDAVALDVSDLDNVLKLLNNGNNFDNSNVIRDYVRAVSEKSERKPKPPNYFNKLPLSPQQKTKIRDIYRRSGQPDDGQYGLPFQLDVQGLGQINP